MKLYRTLLLILILFVTFEQKIYSQCDDETGVFVCAEQLMFDEVIYLSDFPANTQTTKNLQESNGLSWDIFLNENTNYRFALCCDDGLDDIVMKLYDTNSTEDNPYGSTFEGKIDSNTFDYKCYKSGVYNVSIRFKEGKGIGRNLCAIGLMGFVGKIR